MLLGTLEDVHADPGPYEVASVIALPAAHGPDLAEASWREV